MFVPHRGLSGKRRGVSDGRSGVERWKLGLDRHPRVVSRRHLACLPSSHRHSAPDSGAADMFGVSQGTVMRAPLVPSRALRWGHMPARPSPPLPALSPGSVTCDGLSASANLSVLVYKAGGGQRRKRRGVGRPYCYTWWWLLKHQRTFSDSLTWC